MVRKALLFIERPDDGQKEGIISSEDCYQETREKQDISDGAFSPNGGDLLLENGWRPQREHGSERTSMLMSITSEILRRLSTTLPAISCTLDVKRIPVIKSYTKHQHFFTGPLLHLM